MIVLIHKHKNDFRIYSSSNFFVSENTALWMKIQVISSEGVCWLISQTNYSLLCSKQYVEFSSIYIAWEMQTGLASVWVLCKCNIGQIPQIPPTSTTLRRKRPEYPLNMLYARSVCYFISNKIPPGIKKICKSAKPESSKTIFFLLLLHLLLSSVVLLQCCLNLQQRLFDTKQLAC